MASERRPSANNPLDLLQSLLETPMPAPAVRLARPRILARSAKKMAEADAVVLPQALLDTPLDASDTRRGPVVLRAVEPRRYPKVARSAS